MNGIDQIVLSLTARGLTTGEIAAHVEEVYGAKVLQGHEPAATTSTHRKSMDNYSCYYRLTPAI